MLALAAFSTIATAGTADEARHSSRPLPHGLLLVHQVAFNNSGGKFQDWDTPSRLGLTVSIKAPLAADGSPDYEAIKVPETFPPPEMPTYVFCSTRKPLIAFWSDQLEKQHEWHAHMLPIGNLDGIAGYTTSGHAIYWAVCHGVFEPADEMYSEDMIKRAQLLKYRPEWKESDQIAFRSLEELYNYLELR